MTKAAAVAAGALAAKALATGNAGASDGEPLLLGRVLTATSGTAILTNIPYTNSANGTFTAANLNQGRAVALQAFVGTFRNDAPSPLDGPIGLYAVSGSADGYGAWGEALGPRGKGLRGIAVGAGGRGVDGLATGEGGIAVMGNSTSGPGLFGGTGASDPGAAVYGFARSGGRGVWGQSKGGIGVRAESDTGLALLASGGDGVRIETTDGKGVALRAEGRVAFSQAGTATIPAGATQVEVRGLMVEATSAAVASLNTNPPAGVSIKAVRVQAPDGIIVSLNRKTGKALVVSYFVFDGVG